MALRDEVLRALEGLRQDKLIASSQEAAVALHCTDEDAQLVEGFGKDHFAALCIVSGMALTPGADQTSVSVTKSTEAKCRRCWNHRPSVGEHKDYTDLCDRCVSVVA